MCLKTYSSWDLWYWYDYETNRCSASFSSSLLLPPVDCETDTPVSKVSVWPPGWSCGSQWSSNWSLIFQLLPKIKRRLSFETWHTYLPADTIFLVLLVRSKMDDLLSMSWDDPLLTTGSAPTVLLMELSNSLSPPVGGWTRSPITVLCVQYGSRKDPAPRFSKQENIGSLVWIRSPYV